MFSISSWNFRGLNRFSKQQEVQEVMHANEINVCAILKTHIVEINLKRICDSVFQNWDWVSNNSKCQGATRIIVGWDPGIVDLMILSYTDQVIHCQLKIIAKTKVYIVLSFMLVILLIIDATFGKA